MKAIQEGLKTSATLQQQRDCSTTPPLVRRVRRIAASQQQQQQHHHRQAAAAEAAAAPTAAAAATFAAQHQEKKCGVGVTTFPVTLCLQIQTSQASKDLIFNFRIRRTLHASNQVVVLANRDCPAICAPRPVTACISAAWRIGSDVTAGHPFQVFRLKGFRYRLPL